MPLWSRPLIFVRLLLEVQIQLFPASHQEFNTVFSELTVHLMVYSKAYRGHLPIPVELGLRLGKHTTSPAQ